MLIYKVTNKINGQVYIGQTTHSLEHRKRRHENDSLNSNRKTIKFHNALLKYGFDNFKWEVLKECNSQEELDFYEKYYIKEYNACDRNKGYNLKYGGRAGGIFTDEAKANLGKSTKRKLENPESAARMLSGLRKGTETIKEKSKLYFVEKVCPTCGQTFRVKPCIKKIYCSHECANIANRPKLIENSKKAAILAHLMFLEQAEPKKNKIIEWAFLHKNIIENAKLNDLKFLKDLAMYIGVKDTRTLGKILDVKYKKEILYKLKDIIKCTPNTQETV